MRQDDRETALAFLVLLDGGRGVGEVTGGGGGGARQDTDGGCVSDRVGRGVLAPSLFLAFFFLVWLSLVARDRSIDRSMVMVKMGWDLYTQRDDGRVCLFFGRGGQLLGENAVLLRYQD